MVDLCKWVVVCLKDEKVKVLFFSKVLLYSSSYFVYSASAGLALSSPTMAASITSWATLNLD